MALWISFPSLSCTLGTPADTHPVGTSSKTEVTAPLAGLPEAGKALHVWDLPWSPKPWSCPSHWPPSLPSLAWYSPHHHLSRRLGVLHIGKAKVIVIWEKVLNCIPLERIFRRKSTSFFSDTFWHFQQIGVLLNLPKQVSCPSSPSVPFSCLDKAHMDRNMQLIVPLENTLRWLWLAALFPCFLRVGMRVLSPYNSQGKQPKSGENAILTPFHDSLGSERVLASAHLGCCSKFPCGKLMSCLIHKRSPIHKPMALILKSRWGNWLLLYLLINDFNDCLMLLHVGCLFKWIAVTEHTHTHTQRSIQLKKNLFSTTGRTIIILDNNPWLSWD